MPAFKRFGPGDQIDNVLVLEPRWAVASGAAGWHGSPEGSASVSLYGAARRGNAAVFKDIRYSPTWPKDSFGQQVRSQPQTASINVAWMVPGPLALGQRSSTTWGEEHWDTVVRLYQDYHRVDPDYVTGTYDHYCVYFQRDSLNIAAAAPFGTNPLIPSASFTLESWVKPFQTSSATNDFTILSRDQDFWFGITGSTGMLVLSSSRGVLGVSNFGPEERRWSHVAVVVSGSSGSFFVNLSDAGTFSASYDVSAPTSFTASLCLGNVWGAGTFNKGQGSFENVGSPFSGTLRKSFHGFIGETRVWLYSARTLLQLSSSYNSRMVFPFPTGSTPRDRQLLEPFVYSLNDGPLGGPLNALGALPTLGSGAFDLTNSGSQFSTEMYFQSFSDRPGPSWHPNDNMNFFVPKNLIAASPPGMLVVQVPSAFYGRQISPSSISLTCRAYSSGSQGLVRTLIDDGRGNIFLSGSACSSTLANKEDYRGVEWNKVGNVFYGEGLIVIKEPSLLDFGGWSGQVGQSTSHPNDTFQLSFRGTSRVPVKTLMCRIDRGDLNASSNRTFWQENDDGMRTQVHPSASLRVTTVGVYNSERELVGVARLAEPIRVRSKDRLCIKIRCDF